MQTRYLLAVCLIMIAGSVALAPGLIRFGLDAPIAAGLSKVLLAAGIVTAVLTVDAEAREFGKQGK